MSLSQEDREGWLERWREGRIGFHLDRTHPFLKRHQDWLLPSAGARVLVPLCGKSVDLSWLAKRGHEVVGVEIAPRAAEEFYETLGQSASVADQGAFQSWTTKGIEFLVGDMFDLDPGVVGRFDAIWDRAALIALSPDDRVRYVRLLLDLLEPGGRMLLCTLWYDESKMEGPPFSVRGDEVRRHYENVLPLEKLEEKDVTDGNPRFRKSGLRKVTEELWSIG